MHKFNLNSEHHSKFSFTEPWVSNGPLYIGTAFNTPFMWAAVDFSLASYVRTFEVYETGEEVRRGRKYLGSAITDGGRYVSHVFEVM
jgi:hypothetical protein